MRFPAKVRYGTRVLLDIASQPQTAPMPLKEIAARQQISTAYLEQVIGPLLTVGLLRSSRGSRGGFRLGKAPDKIRLIEAVRALEGPVTAAECVGSPDSCPRSANCASRDVWAEVAAAVDGVLESITLEELVERQRAKEPYDTEPQSAPGRC